MIIAIDYHGCGRFRSESTVVTIKIVHYYAYHLSRNYCRQSKVGPEKYIPGCKFRSLDILLACVPFCGEGYIYVNHSKLMESLN